MSQQKIVIIDYGAGNLFSVANALESLGYPTITSNNAEEILTADKVIFPGVGHAASAMQNLKASKLDLLIPELKQPVLGICLGMQLMCESSEEGNTKGLNIFPEQVKLFKKAPKVPHMGWNQIHIKKEPLWSEVKNQEFMYFVHSYYVPLSPYTIASCDYARKFSAALRKDNFTGIQFHPEKSSNAGLQILKNFIQH